MKEKYFRGNNFAPFQKSFDLSYLLSKEKNNQIIYTLLKSMIFDDHKTYQYKFGQKYHFVLLN